MYIRFLCWEGTEDNGQFQVIVTPRETVLSVHKFLFGINLEMNPTRRRSTSTTFTNITRNYNFQTSTKVHYDSHHQSGAKDNNQVLLHLAKSRKYNFNIYWNRLIILSLLSIVCVSSTSQNLVPQDQKYSTIVQRQQIIDSYLHNTTTTKQQIIPNLKSNFRSQPNDKEIQQQQCDQDQQGQYGINTAMKHDHDKFNDYKEEDRISYVIEPPSSVQNASTAYTSTMFETANSSSMNNELSTIDSSSVTQQYIQQDNTQYNNQLPERTNTDTLTPTSILWSWNELFPSQHPHYDDLINESLRMRSQIQTIPIQTKRKILPFLIQEKIRTLIKRQQNVISVSPVSLSSFRLFDSISNHTFLSSWKYFNKDRFNQNRIVRNQDRTLIHYNKGKIPSNNNRFTTLSQDHDYVVSLRSSDASSLLVLLFTTCNTFFSNAVFGTIITVIPLYAAQKVLQAIVLQPLQDWYTGRYIRITYSNIERQYRTAFGETIPSTLRCIGRICAHLFFLFIFGKIVEVYVIHLNSSACLHQLYGGCHWWCACVWMFLVIGAGHSMGNAIAIWGPLEINVIDPFDDDVASNNKDSDNGNNYRHRPSGRNLFRRPLALMYFVLDPDQWFREIVSNERRRRQRATAVAAYRSNKPFDPDPSLFPSTWLLIRILQIFAVCKEMYYSKRIMHSYMRQILVLQVLCDEWYRVVFFEKRIGLGIAVMAGYIYTTFGLLWKVIGRKPVPNVSSISTLLMIPSVVAIIITSWMNIVVYMNRRMLYGMSNGNTNNNNNGNSNKQNRGGNRIKGQDEDEETLIERILGIHSKLQSLLFDPNQKAEMATKVQPTKQQQLNIDKNKRIGASKNTIKIPTSNENRVNQYAKAAVEALSLNIIPKLYSR